MLRFAPISFLTLGVLLILGVLGAPLWSLGVVAFGWLVLTVIGSFHMGWNYHVASLCQNPNIDKNWVALSFDDGPHPEFTPKVLKLLEEYGAKASFFCVGKHMEKYPHLTQRILEEGHVLGNHTFSHSPFFGFFGHGKVVAELEKTQQVSDRILGVRPKLYRPAFGVTNPSIGKSVSDLDLTVIGWNRRSLDTTSLSEEKVYGRVVKKLRRGDVVLLHDTSGKTVAVLERLLVFLRDKNLESVTVDRLLNVTAYA